MVAPSVLFQRCVAFRSRTIESIKAEVERLAASGS